MKTTLVHLYRNHWSWRGRKFAANLNGKMLLTRAIVEAGFTGVRVQTHRRRQLPRRAA
jgi:hypothetical protein